MKKIRTKRGVLEQNLKELGLDGQDTVSYFAKSLPLQKLIKDNRDLLNWQLSLVPNPNMLDLQWASEEA